MIRYASSVAPNTTKLHESRNVVAYGFSGNRFDLVEENIKFEFRAPRCCEWVGG